MKRLNVRTTDKVVCYDTGSMGFFSYRVAWMMHCMGHNNVSVLNGGFQKWVKEGKPCESADTHDDGFNYKMDPEKIKNFD